MKNSIRVRFTLLFVGVTALTIVACLLMNLYFLEDYYIEYKQEIVINEVAEINQTLQMKNSEESSEASLQSSTTDNDQDEISKDFFTDSDIENHDEMTALLQKIRDVYNLTAIIVGNDGKVSYSSSPDISNLAKRLQRYMFFSSSTGSEKIIYESSLYKICTTERLSSNYMDCWGFLDDGSYFIISTPLDSIKDSVTVSNEFFAIIGVFGILISALIMLVVTRRLTRPILELSSISERMAKLDFTAKYTGDSKDEIGTLGASMNNLSQQLEGTINELKTANVQLTKDIEEKIQIDEMRKEFLSNVSHELKTPIALIQGYAEGLQDFINEDPESREFYCEVIIDEANKMNQMVQKLLTLNHLEFGEDALDCLPFSMTELINSVINSVDILVKQKECSISFVPLDEYMPVYADEFQIEEVIRNYVSNALNHLSGRNVIEIKASLASDNPNKYRISVFNSGEAIPDEDLEKVWIKFYKVDKARTREYGGSGIGLSIVKAIMDLHNCAYGVHNINDGVEFWIEINRYYPKEDEMK